MRVFSIGFYALLHLLAISSAQLDPASPQCAKGYAISSVDVQTVQVNGAQSTAIVQVQFTANLNSVAAKAMTVCFFYDMISNIY